MAIGTNFSDNNVSKNGGTVNHYLTNDTDKWILIRGTAALISAETGAGYAIGCIAMATDTGAAYYNSGTATTASWTAFNSAAFTVPTSVTDSTTTTGNSFRVLTTAGTFTTGGSAIKADLAAGTVGNGLVAITTGAYTGTGLLKVSGVAATTGTLGLFSATALTSGYGLQVVAGSALTTGGALAYLDMGSSTAGQGVTVVTTGAYTGTGLITLTAGAMTTGVGLSVVSTTGLTSGSLIRATSSTAGLLATNGAISFVATGNFTTTTVGFLDVSSTTSTAGIVARVLGTGLTTGVALKVQAVAATLTTGRYISVSDGTTEVFGVGLNGHLISTQTTAPTIGTNSTGISACAITAGSTDTCGTITTTGTPQSGTVLTITFNGTYTTAPKFVTVEAANGAAGGINTPPIITQTATTFVLTWPAGGVYAATPSFTYFVVA